MLGPGRQLDHARRGHDAQLVHAVRGVEQPVRADGRMMLAGDLRHLAGDCVSGALERVHSDDAGQQGRADHLPATGALPFVQAK